MSRTKNATAGALTLGLLTGIVLIPGTAQAATTEVYANRLDVSVSGTSVTAVTNVQTSVKTSLPLVGTCARDANGGDRDFPLVARSAEAWTDVTVSGTQTLPAGSYTAFPCAQLPDGTWPQVMDPNGNPYQAKPFSVTSTGGGTTTPPPAASPSSVGPDKFAYAGTWNTVASPAEKWSNTTGDTATIQATIGTGGGTVSLRRIGDLWQGKVGIVVDNGPEVIVDQYANPRQADTVYWTSGQLTAGQHDIKVRNTGTKNANALDDVLSVSGASTTNGTLAAPAGGGTTTPPTTPPPPPASSETWTWQENFDKAAPLGTFKSNYPTWGTYDGDLTTPGDTSKRGVYDTGATTSVANGALTQRLAYVNGKQRVSAVLAPVNGDAWGGAKFGVYEERMRITDPSTTYKVADLFWPSSDDWADGEIDWVEATDVGPGTKPRPAAKQRGNYNSNFLPPTEQFAPAAVADGNWHTYRTEWAPNRVAFYQDGTLVATVTDSNYIIQMGARWVLQKETTLSGSLSTSDPAVFETDFVRYHP